MAVSAERLASYERAKRRLPGLLAASGFRERAWMLAGVAGLIFGGVESHMATNKVAEQKLAAAKCEPWLLNSEGHRLAIVPLNKAETSQLNGLVASRLFEAVTCLRGLDFQPKAVSECWRKNMPLFVGDEAVRKLDEYRRENFASEKQIRQRQDEETVEITPMAWDNPDKALPNRFWLRWAEQHYTRSGQKEGKPEVCSGTFDTELVTPNERGGDMNPIRVTMFAWKRDVVTGN